MIVQTTVTPPTGWHIVENGIRIEAGSHEDLIVALTRHRSALGGDTTSVVVDIDNYICSKWPDYCRPGQNNSIPPEALNRRVQLYASGLAGQAVRGGYTLVLEAEGERRAKICAECPFNKPWDTGCRSCTQAVRNLLSQTRGHRTTSMDARLFGCAILGVDNKTDNQLDRDTPQAAKDRLPQNCWRLQ